MNDLSPSISLVQPRPRALSAQEVGCRYCGLLGMCEEAGLSRDTRLLERVVHRRTALAKGAVLFRCGAPFNQLFALKSGALAAVADDGRGGRKYLGFYFPGDVVGLDGVETGYYPLEVVALEKSSVCRLDYSKASLLGEHQQGFYQEVIRAMSRRLMFERWTTLLLGAASTEQRLAVFILYFSSQLHLRSLPHTNFRLPMTRHDIADYLGLAMETVSRAISSLQRRGLISVQGRNIQLVDLPGLQQLAGLSNAMTYGVLPEAAA